MANDVFLETTIQIDRNFSYTQGAINNILWGKNLYSSAYVFGEYKRSILYDAITFYNLLEMSDSTAEALERLGEVLHSTRRYNRVMKTFNAVFEDGRMQKTDVKKRLNFLIEETIITRFMRGIKELVNEIQCQRANAYPEMVNGLWRLNGISCRQRPKPGCQVAEFIQKSVEQFIRIGNITDDNIQDLVNTVKNYLQKGILPYGANCWKMADALISCEVPEHIPIYSTNKKDYAPICNIIGRFLYEPDDNN